jgi:hypothetical protein
MSIRTVPSASDDWGMGQAERHRVCRRSDGSFATRHLTGSWHRLGEQFTSAEARQNETCRVLWASRRHGDGYGLVLSC